MKVGLAGPIHMEFLAPRLRQGGESGNLPIGLAAGTPVTLLALELLRRGHEVVVATLSPDVSHGLRFKGEGLTVRVGHYRPRHRARDLFRVERDHITEALRREAPDIVHAHWTYEYALGALASGAPTLVTIRDWAPTILRLSPDPYRLVRLLMHTAAVVRSRHLTVTSPYMHDLVRRWKRVDVPIIPNAVDDGAFRPRTRPLDSSPHLIAVNNGFFGRKNLPVLLEAFALVRKRVPACRLTLVGATQQPDGEAHRWARMRGLDQHVDFYGSVPYARLPDLMRRADVFVHPSLEESFGMVLVEAMSQGLPVVGGRDSGAVPWVLNNGQAGNLTDVRSPRAVSDAILEMVSDEARWRYYSMRGYAHASEHFRLSRVVDAYVKEYSRVLTDVGH